MNCYEMTSSTRQEMSQQQIQAPLGSGHLAVFQRSGRALETAGDAFSLDSGRKRAKLHNSTDVTRLSDTVATLLNAQNITSRIEINFTQNTAKLSSPNQPSLPIKPHTSLTAAPCNVATYPIVSSDPQSQMIFFVSQPEPYTQEYQSAYGTTTVGLYPNQE
ncbi:uncharacterized protein PpBr36_10989 [Pyricularia pennisetigena]|uniref:uncharacterized protein n=1 Tax=Pyricularia pennisetigena TaxID=1578925 RepID=UPI001151A45D|nr:uncharacterized protein PpBr36_10989 [Pyricularia pennisetigena]TLS20756.1 hypothetical protein PpBr36_10989 [Pyricularia pennisetigena]